MGGSFIRLTQVGASTRVIHVFDREGDIAEVFEQVRQLEQVGVVILDRP